MEMAHSAVVGTSLELQEFFYDDYGDPIEVDGSVAPVVRLVDPATREVLVTTSALEGDDEAEWNANIPVPELDISEKIELRLIWVIETTDGRFRHSDVLYVEPNDEERESDIVVLEQNPKAAFKIPVVLNIPQDDASYTMYEGNTSLGTVPLTDVSVTVTTRTDHTLVAGTFNTGGASLTPYFMQFEYQLNGQVVPTFLTYSVWVVNPSILDACRSIEEFLNKARIQNVIPELDYAQTDLLEYLSRGLNLFNAVQQMTSFTGLNMIGVIRECWIICSTYYALSAQLQAEGAMAFDFSGQTVSLNIDRTPALEGALGRIEQQIESTVKPAKKQMLKAGVKGGDGNTTATNTAQNFGRLGISNAATTKIVGGSNRFRRC
jgi:hypothetical protein